MSGAWYRMYRSWLLKQNMACKMLRRVSGSTSAGILCPFSQHLLHWRHLYSHTPPLLPHQWAHNEQTSPPYPPPLQPPHARTMHKHEASSAPQGSMLG